MGSLRRFLLSRTANFAVATALIAPLLLGVAGGAVDVYVYVNHQADLQEAVDGAALAAAREASLGGWTEAKAVAVADAHLQANVAHVRHGSGVVRTTVEVDEGSGRVEVTAEQDHHGYMVVGYFSGSPQIRVSAAAQASSSVNVCVIGLNAVQDSTVSLDSNAILHAPNCAVYSNSSNRSGMRSLSNAVLTASLACTSGGYEGSRRNFNAAPLTDCPAVADPLAGRLPPEVAAGCKSTRLKLDDYVGTIGPGVYCNGLEINGNSKVTMQPGIYVIKNGQFLVDSNSVVTGIGVGLYFTGSGSNFHFKSNVNVSLEAPNSGSMAGLIFYQDRAAAVTNFTIESNYTRKLIGTIYLPKGNLVVKADNDVADQSAYTAIVVQKLQLFSGPRLVLNTDYGDTSVPVPAGLGPQGGQLRLVR